MVVNALSIVHPAVQDIIAGIKTIEIRSWFPSDLPIYGLFLVENHCYLREAGEEDPDGLLVSVVDVTGVHPWTREEAKAADKRWEPGYYAWELAHIRKVAEPIRVVARRHIYELEVPESLSSLLKDSGTLP